jgi:hypothetical protein
VSSVQDVWCPLGEHKKGSAETTQFASGSLNFLAGRWGQGFIVTCTFPLQPVTGEMENRGKPLRAREMT